MGNQKGSNVIGRNQYCQLPENAESNISKEQMNQVRTKTS